MAAALLAGSRGMSPRRLASSSRLVCRLALASSVLIFSLGAGGVGAEDLEDYQWSADLSHEWSLGLQLSDASSMGFGEGLELIGSGTRQVSNLVALHGSINAGTITKTESEDGASWGYSLEARVGRGSCWLRTGIAGSGYSASTAEGQGWSKSVAAAPLVGFACDVMRKRVRWGGVALLRPITGDGLSDQDDDVWSLSLPLSYLFRDGRWRYGSTTSVTSGFDDELWSWALWVERRWR